MSEGLSRRGQLECLIVGAENSGKTVLLRRLCSFRSSNNDQFNDFTTPTIGQEVFTLGGDGDTSITIREIGGRMGSGWMSYIKLCTSLILCVDISDPSLLATSFILFHEILGQDDLKGKGILLLFTKRDQVDRIGLRIFLNAFRIDEISSILGSRIDTLIGSTFDFGFVTAVHDWIQLNNS